LPGEGITKRGLLGRGFRSRIHGRPADLLGLAPPRQQAEARHHTLAAAAFGAPDDRDGITRIDVELPIPVALDLDVPAALEVDALRRPVVVANFRQLRSRSGAFRPAGCRVTP